MYQKRVKNVQTGETGIVVARPADDCPNIDIASDAQPALTVCWPKKDCVILDNGQSKS